MLLPLLPRASDFLIKCHLSNFLNHTFYSIMSRFVLLFLRSPFTQLLLVPSSDIRVILIFPRSEFTFIITFYRWGGLFVRDEWCRILHVDVTCRNTNSETTAVVWKGIEEGRTRNRDYCSGNTFDVGDDDEFLHGSNKCSVIRTIILRSPKDKKKGEIERKWSDVEWQHI